MNYQVKENTINLTMDLDKKIILENAFDSYHVSSVHKSSVKSVDVLHDNGDMQILLYEIYSLPYLKFLTAKFVVLKISSGDDITFYSIPAKLNFITKYKISCKQNKDNTSYTANFQFRPMNLFYSFLSPLVMKLRNRGENQRLNEDIALMKLRTEALKNKHIDNPHCINQTPLLKKLFK